MKQIICKNVTQDSIKCYEDNKRPSDTQTLLFTREKNHQKALLLKLFHFIAIFIFIKSIVIKLIFSN